LREEILDAAIVLIDETGDPGSLTLRGVARRAGISAPSIYPHFGDLSTLLEAVLSRSFDELRDAVAAAVDVASDAARALVAAGLAYVRFASTHPARYRLMFSADGYAPNAVDTFGLVEGLIRSCTALGLSSSTDPHRDAWMVWAGLHGVATLDKPSRPEYLRLGTLDRTAMLEEIVVRLAGLHHPVTSSRPAFDSGRTNA
jgi:AcrR family transcriptional regulator